jgi:pimeloyl-ACP methyl ester carboxylesterase
MCTNLKNLVSKRDTSNVFEDSMNRANEAGRELADKIVEHFGDRHVTLVGFSMGAEVIRVCLERLA